MANAEKTTQPSMGSNDVGSETNDSPLTGVSSGTDTQLHLAAKSGGKHTKNSGNKHTKNINDDEKVVRNTSGEEEFLESGETDE